MNTLTIAKRLWILIACALLAVLAVGVVGYTAAISAQKGVIQIRDDSLVSIKLLAKVSSDFQRVRVNAYAHVASTDEAQMADLEKRLKGFEESIKEGLKRYSGLVSSAEDKALLEAGQQATSRYIATFYEKVLPKSRKSETAAGLALMQGEGAIGSNYLAQAEQLVPEQPRVREQAFTAALLAGDLDVAGRIAPEGEGVSPVIVQAGRLVSAVQTFVGGDARRANALFKAAPIGAPHDRAGFAVGIMGAGVLGQRVLDCLKPFGFPLHAWSRNGKEIDGVTCHAGMAGLDAFLRQSRVVVCMLPLTEETTNILNRANLAKMPPGSYVINVARGSHLAEPDLLTYIKSGHIAGATLDVFRNEPLPAQHPFWQEPRITITPHIAALTLRDESVRQIAGKIALLEAGKPCADIVNRELGY